MSIIDLSSEELYCCFALYRGVYYQACCAVPPPPPNKATTHPPHHHCACAGDSQASQARALSLAGREALTADGMALSCCGNLQAAADSELH